MLENNGPYSSISFTSSLISFTDRADGPNSSSMYQQREVSPIFPDRHQIRDSTALSNILKCPHLLTRNVTVTAHKERENVLMKKKKNPQNVELNSCDFCTKVVSPPLLWNYVCWVHLGFNGSYTICLTSWSRRYNFLEQLSCKAAFSGTDREANHVTTVETIVETGRCGFHVKVLQVFHVMSHICYYKTLFVCNSKQVWKTLQTIFSVALNVKGKSYSLHD